MMSLASANDIRKRYPVVYLSPLFQVPGGQGAGLIDEQSVPVIVNPVPDTPCWSVPEFPLMAAEDEAMMVPDVSVNDPDGEEYLRITVSAEKGYVSLPRAASRDLTGVEEGVREDDDGRQALIMVGSEIALNEALKGLAYYPPPDWTSFREVLHGRCVSLMSSTREGIEKYGSTLASWTRSPTRRSPVMFELDAHFSWNANGV